jgi:hypothetical protein
VFLTSSDLYVRFFLPSLGHEGDEGDEGQEVDEEGHEGALDYRFKNVNCIGPKKAMLLNPATDSMIFFTRSLKSSGCGIPFSESVSLREEEDHGISMSFLSCVTTVLA